MKTKHQLHAAEVLGVPVTATEAEATSAFLAVLPGSDFVPSADQIAAINTLGGLKLVHDADVEPTIGIQAEVAEFTQAFWSLSPIERESEWVSLRARADESTAPLLAVFEAALRLPTSPLPNPIEEEIASLARELFILPSRARAIRRNEWLLTNASRWETLVQAARELVKQSPEIADLDPVFFARLEPKFALSEFVAGATAEPMVIRSSDPTYAALAGLPRPEAIQVAPISSEQSQSRGRTAGGTGLAILGAFVVLARLISALGSNSTSSVSTYNAPISLPYKTTPDTVITVTYVFNQEQVESFKKHEEETRGRPPSRYAEWVWAGRPAPGQVVRIPLKNSINGSNGAYFVSFSANDISKFEKYELNPIGPRPARYDLWVQAGRPHKAGDALTFPANQDPPTPRP